MVIAPQHLHAVVAVLDDDDVAVAVEHCGPWMTQLTFTATVAADGAKTESIGVSKGGCGLKRANGCMKHTAAHTGPLECGGC
jgi:hypothetical protein